MASVSHGSGIKELILLQSTSIWRRDANIQKLILLNKVNKEKSCQLFIHSLFDDVTKLTRSMVMVYLTNFYLEIDKNRYA